MSASIAVKACARVLSSLLTCQGLIALLHGRDSAGGEVGHFIAEKVFRPVHNVAVKIDLKWLDLRRLARRGAEVYCDVFRSNGTFGDATLKTIEKVLGVALHDELHVSGFAIFRGLGGGD